MKKLLYLFYVILVILFLEGLTDHVARLPNKSMIIYFAQTKGNSAPKEFRQVIQKRYDVAVYTNDIFVVPSTMYVVNGKLSHSLDIRSLGKIRFKYQVFPRCYYMDYNPIGFMLYVSDRCSDEYYGGIVMTGISPQMINFKINPFGRQKDYETPLPTWVNKVVQQPSFGTQSEVVIEYPEELRILSDSYMAPFLYFQSGCGIVLSKSLGYVDASNRKDFYDFPFSVYVNGRAICKTVSELYSDSFLLDFNEALCHF